jgi:hypothetical protein
MTFIIRNNDGLFGILEYDWVKRIPENRKTLMPEIMIAKSLVNGDGL